MNEHELLAGRFEQTRTHLRAVAYRILGSLSEADDAVQEAWLKLSRSDASEIENLTAWLTTVVARVCLDTLRSRKSRRQEPGRPHVPDPVVSREDGEDPERQLLFADALGLALLVILETLAPAERLAFVLHDMFALPFDEIAPIVGSSATAARQLASRARRRVQGASVPDRDLTRQRAVVDAFLAASRGGDFAALVAILDPNVVLRADGGSSAPHASNELRGAANVAKGAIFFSQLAGNANRTNRPVLVNGAAGIASFEHGAAQALLGFTIVNGLIAEIDILNDPERLRQLDLSGLDHG